MPTRLRNYGANLIHEYIVEDIPDPDDINNVMEGVDLQTYMAIKYVGGDGVITGGVILDTKQVGPTRCAADGRVAYTTDNQAIVGLVDGKENIVWAVRVDAPTVGLYQDDPAYDTTFNAGVISFLAQDLQPAHSFLLGSITLDGAGAVTAIDNAPLDRPTLLGCATKTWAGSVAIAGLAEGAEVWVDIDHSGDITFAGKLLFAYNNPEPEPLGGFEVRCIENCQADKSRMLVYNGGDPYEPYYGDTGVTITVAITGIEA